MQNRPGSRAGSRAGAILVGSEVTLEGTDCVVVSDPYRAFAQIMQYWHPTIVPEPVVDSAAWVSPDAIVDGVRVEAFAWVGPGARIGPGSWLQAGAVVGAGAIVGRDCFPRRLLKDSFGLRKNIDSVPPLWAPLHHCLANAATVSGAG